MQRRYVRHWSERGWKKPRNTLGSFACFFQAFAAQLITEIHSSYLTDSGIFYHAATQQKIVLNRPRISAK